jgi:hypothetical protein
MTAIEQAQELQQQAVAILLAEREKIDTHLTQLGYGREMTRGTKRGRPVKNAIQQQVTERES